MIGNRLLERKHGIRVHVGIVIWWERLNHGEWDHIDGSVHDCSNSSVLAMELLQSCTEPLISYVKCSNLTSYVKWLHIFPKSLSIAQSRTVFPIVFERAWVVPVERRCILLKKIICMIEIQKAYICHLVESLDTYYWWLAEYLIIMFFFSPGRHTFRHLFNIKMSSYHYTCRKSHCGDKVVIRLSNLHNGNSYTDMLASWCWISPQAPVPLTVFRSNSKFCRALV